MRRAGWVWAGCTDGRYQWLHRPAWKLLFRLNNPMRRSLPEGFGQKGSERGSPPQHIRRIAKVVPVTLSRGRWPKVDQDSGIEDAALLILEWLGEQGVGALLRVDAERMLAGEPAWTFVASSGPLERVVRADGATVQQCLSFAIARLREAGVDVPF
jgi:hypothetical protein